MIHAGLAWSLLLCAGGVPVAPKTSPMDGAIVPKPMSITPGKGYFRITPKTIIVVTGESTELERLGKYLAGCIKESGGFPLTVRKTSDDIQPAVTITLTLTGAVANLDEEGYILELTGERAVIRALKPAGIFYGIQTLRQMAITAEGRRGKYLIIPGMTITDKPRFAWRGMLLDCGRHFMTKDFVKRYIDLLAFHKMNVFHWHLTEDQGWRIEIKRYPKLTEVGAWRMEGDKRYGGYYTQDDIREVVQYAAERYVMVVPEIEMPGHATAALAAYPEYSCAGQPIDVENTWGVKTNLFCAGKEETFTFLENILTEVSELFPALYIHIGGDEAKKDKWKACPLCQKRIKDEGLKDESELQGYFTRRMDKFVQSLNRRTIGWDEILEGKPSTSAIVESWRGMEGAVEGSKKGHFIISAPYTHTYFDQPIVDDGTQPGWMVVTPLEKTYAFQAAPAELTPDQAAKVLGAEGAMWTEHAHQPEVDSKVFPRLCAFSETVWTPASLRDWPDFQQRMGIHSKRLDALEVDSYTPNTRVGVWAPKELSSSFATHDWNITRFLNKKGAYRTTFVQDGGAGKVAVEWAAILENGKEIDRDTHQGVTGKNKLEQNYRFALITPKPGAVYTLRASLRNEGGINTSGSVWMQCFKNY